MRTTAEELAATAALDPLLMPHRMYRLNQSSAVLDRVDLGGATRLHENPVIGDVPPPARAVLAIGQAMWPIRDPGEFERARCEARDDSYEGTAP